jgi:hypothetical protein
MSVRYFQTPAGAAQYGNLTEDGLRVLLDAGYEEITAEEYEAEQAKQEEAHAALLQPPAPADSTEQAQERASGRNKR